MDHTSTSLYPMNRRADAAQGITNVHSGPLPPCPCFWVLVVSDEAGWCRTSSGSTLCISLRKEPGQSNLPSGWIQTMYKASCALLVLTACFEERCLHCYPFPVLSFRQEYTKSLTSSVQWPLQPGTLSTAVTTGDGIFELTLGQGSPPAVHSPGIP